MFSFSSGGTSCGSGKNLVQELAEGKALQQERLRPAEACSSLLPWGTAVCPPLSGPADKFPTEFQVNVVQIFHFDVVKFFKGFI